LQITQKEAFSLQELLDREQLLVQKFGSYASETRDPQFAEICRRAQQAHTYHYQMLLKHLNASSNLQ